MSPVSILFFIFGACYSSSASDATEACKADGSCTADEESFIQKTQMNKSLQPNLKGVDCNTIDRSGPWCCWYPYEADRCSKCAWNSCTVAKDCAGTEGDSVNARCNWNDPPVPPAPGCDDPQPGNTNGDNLLNYALHPGDANACANECASRPDCHSWTFVPNYVTTRQNECWLKKSADSITPDKAGVMSGYCHPRPGPNPPSPGECRGMENCKNNWGGNIGGPTTVYSSTECEAHCGNDPTCKGWTFVPNTMSDTHQNQCWKKNWVKNPADQTTCGIWSGYCH